MLAAGHGNANMQRRSRQGHVRQRGHGGGGGATALVPASAMGLPPGVDPLTLDPDQAFVRFGVKEVQTIEQSLRTSCDTLTARLRLLVSERYRDMLGTANTLIEMSSSSSNLVQQLDKLSAGVASSESNLEAPTAYGLFNDSTIQGAVEHTQDTQKQVQRDLFAVAACTKLVAEAPDELWRAIGAINKHRIAHSDSATEHRIRSATIMRAAYIYVLANEAWSWLIDAENRRSLAKQLKIDEGAVDIKTLFPYIARQRAALQPMRDYMVQLAQTGLSSPVTTNRSTHHNADLYQATITNLASLAILDGYSISRSQKELLQSRREALRSYVQKCAATDGQGGPANLVIILLQFSSTLLHVVKAFALSESSNSSVCHLRQIRSRLSNFRDAAEPAHAFPPTPLAALQTLPSARAYIEHLPDCVKLFRHTNDDEDRTSKAGESVPEVLKVWAGDVFSNVLAESLPGVMQTLSTIARIGEVQSELWLTLEKCIAQAHRACKTDGERFADAIEGELRLLVKRMDGMLMDRLRGICVSQGDELSRVVIGSIQDAFDAVSDDNGRLTAESNPIRNTFTLDKSSSKHQDAGDGVDALTLKLRMRTGKVQSILSKAEERATSLVYETRAYTEAIERIQSRLDRKQSSLSKEEGQSNNFQAAKEVLAGLQSSIKQAKSSIAEALVVMAERCTGTEDARHSTGSLFLIRLLSALRSSEIFDALDQQDTSFASRLLDIERSLLSAWAEYAVQDALAVFQDHKKSAKAVTKSSADSTEEVQLETSSELLAALSRLSNRCQIVGLGRRNEDIWLRRQILSRFIRVWCQSRNNHVDGPERLLDCEVLRVISRDTSDKTITQPLDDLSARLLSQSRNAEQWHLRVSAVLTPTLARSRLMIGRLVIDEEAFNATLSVNIASKDGRPSAIATSAPAPLPLLRLVQHQERIPRIRPISSTESG